MNTNYKISKSIPIPEAVRRGRKSKYPFADLGPKESFFIEGKKISSISPLIQVWKNKLGYRFIARSVTEEGKAGVRVWRTEEMVADQQPKSNRGRKKKKAEVAV